jgi:hypothetical protein
MRVENPSICKVSRLAVPDPLWVLLWLATKAEGIAPTPELCNADPIDI